MVDSRTLSKEDISKTLPWLKKLVERNKLDVTQDELVETFKEKFEELSARPTFSTKSKLFLMKRAKSRTRTKYITLGDLEKMHAIILGQSGMAMDWNKKEWDLVQKRAKDGGAKEVMVMVNEDIIAWVEEPVDTGDGTKMVKKAVTKLLTPMAKNGDKYVVRRFLDKEKTQKAYELWKPGDPVIPLDTAEFLGDGKTPNFRQGRPLEENWGLNLQALIWRDEMEQPKRATLNVYGDAAKTGHKKNIVDKLRKKGLFGMPIILKAEVNEKKSNSNHFAIKCQTDKFMVKGRKVDDFDIYDKLMNEWAFLPDYTGDPFDRQPIVDKEALDEEYGYLPAIPILDLESAREYFEKLQMLTDDEDGTLKPVLYTRGKKKGQPRPDYDMFGIIDCSIAPRGEPEEGNSIAVSIDDNSLADEKYSGFLPKVYSELPFTGSADVIGFVSINKGKEYYDKDLHDFVEDDDGRRGQLTFNFLHVVILDVHEPEEEEKTQEEESDEGAEEEVNV